MSSPFTPMPSGRAVPLAAGPFPAPRDAAVSAPFGVPSSTMAAPFPDEPLRLADLVEPPRRGPLPLLASLVPVAGSVALWLATGAMLMLWFAALGPLIAVATMLDGRRAARRERARRRAEAETARARVGRLVEERQERERDRLWAGHPDVVTAVGAGVVWTSTAERRATIVVGAGRVPSTVRVSGGEGDPDAAALRARAATLDGAPVAVPAGTGIAVVGPPRLAAAVVRALAAQVLLAAAPGDVRLVGEPHGETAWLQEVPHRRAGTGAVLAVCAPGDPLPEADIVLVRVAEGMPAPPRCGAVLTLTGLDRAMLAAGAETADVGVEGLSLGQARELAAELRTRAAAVFGEPGTAPQVVLADLLDAPADAVPRRERDLAAVIGTAGRTPFMADLVADGPHAVVVGMTGAGKSELLISWVASLCATHTPEQVTFLLADFKGGTAFDALRDLPHVTGVITDLDGSGARRALQSLSAELRWREAQLVQADARDIRDERVRMPRLVVIVDELAALLSEHPELQAVFTDVAARGRALGMHLVLGTQRAAGALRDALLANCPLRICLRVADAADSRAVIGTDAAAALPGGPEGRGSALVRRAGDTAPAAVQVARADAALIAEIAARSSDAVAPRRPWLPELPTRLARADLPAVPAGEIVLGLADEPERQRQVPVLLGDRGLFVVGRAGSGRSTALAAIAGQVPPERLVRVPTDPEAAWDAIAVLSLDDPWDDSGPPPGTVVLVDDLDVVLGGLPGEYALAAGERLDRFARTAPGRGIRLVAGAQRLSGAVSRIADALPRRAILRTASRLDHIAVGGDSRDELPAVPGRALLEGRAMQWLDAGVLPAAPAAEPGAWRPGDGITGLVVRAGAGGGLAGLLTGGGHPTCTVDDFAGRAGMPGPVVVVGDPDAWLRNWRALADVRGGHDLVIDASCAAEYRAITADRELPPYCAPGRARAWLVRPGEPPRRVLLPRP